MPVVCENIVFLSASGAHCHVQQCSRFLYSMVPLTQSHLVLHYFYAFQVLIEVNHLFMLSNLLVFKCLFIHLFL